jgi:hypothetical protein
MYERQPSTKINFSNRYDTFVDCCVSTTTPRPGFSVAKVDPQGDGIWGKLWRSAWRHTHRWRNVTCLWSMFTFPAAWYLVHWNQATYLHGCLCLFPFPMSLGKELWDQPHVSFIQPYRTQGWSWPSWMKILCLPLHYSKVQSDKVAEQRSGGMYTPRGQLRPSGSTSPLAAKLHPWGWTHAVKTGLCLSLGT